ncbi:MAG: ASKHA domain-containing protein [Brevefilum sp.]
MTSSKQALFEIDFQPVGKRVVVSADTSLLAAAQDAGVAISAVCGGIGVCQDCKVRIISGKVSDITNSERDAYSDEELSKGWRLACQVFPQDKLKVEVPSESMTTQQRLQTEGVSEEVELNPSVQGHDFQLLPPDMDDLRADWERFSDEMESDTGQQVRISLPVLAQFSSSIRTMGWAGRALIDEAQCVVGFISKKQTYYGLAVDIGTTKMAVYLVDLVSGKTVGRMAAMNPQIAYGEDVVSRIAYGNQGISYRKALQKRVVDSINDLTTKLCHSVGADYEQIADFVVVGNTVMHHLFAGLSVRQLGEAPYVPALRGALRFPAREIGLKSAPGACVYLPPNIAGYVGSDHTAMLLAAGFNNNDVVSLALDIGTNTEISLAKGDKLVCCSCASGPAFEGAHIHAGMRAIPGAIERAEFFNGEWLVSTIDDVPAVGICGSGILDVVAALLESGQIDATGRFTDKAAGLIDYQQGGTIELVSAEKSGTGQHILVTRADIREIQLAKAAIRAGVEALLRATNTQTDEIERFIVAGAFGTYLHLDSAVGIGMFPGLPRDRYYQIGNAAGIGAQYMLVSKPTRKAAEAILGKMDYIELTTDPGFMENYVEAMGFDQT